MNLNGKIRLRRALPGWLHIEGVSHEGVGLLLDISPVDERGLRFPSQHELRQAVEAAIVDAVNAAADRAQEVCSECLSTWPVDGRLQKPPETPGLMQFQSIVAALGEYHTAIAKWSPADCGTLTQHIERQAALFAGRVERITGLHGKRPEPTD